MAAANNVRGRAPGLVSAFMAAPTDRFSQSIPAWRAPVGCAAPHRSLAGNVERTQPVPRGHLHHETTLQGTKFFCLTEKHPVLAQAAQVRADASDAPDLGSHLQHEVQQRCQTRRMRASSVPCKCSWRVRSRSSGMPRRRWRVRACASTHLRRLLGFGEDISSSSQMNVMCSNSWLFRMLISSNPCLIQHLLLLCWPWPTLPDSSKPITESWLYMRPK